MGVGGSHIKPLEHDQDIKIKLNPWLTRSEAMSIMDFYSDSLSFVAKLTSTIKNCHKELQDVLKPHDNMMNSLLEAEIYKEALDQYREMQGFLIGETVETNGHQYIEDESIMGNSDKMIFYTRELMSEIKKSKRVSLNPYIVAKLDVPTIRICNFPLSVSKDQNPYITR